MRIISFFLLPFLLVLSACDPTESPNLTIATAANASYAIEEIGKAFSDKTHIPCDVIIGSSGKLTAQIQSGAPYDVFISANLKYPSNLFEKGLTTKAPEIYGKGHLVLWTYHSNVPPYLDSLRNEEINTIAIANPKTAPYGRAAMEVLEKRGLKSKIESKLVYGESISQTNQFINSKTVDIGFTAKSVVLAPSIKVKGNWTLINSTEYSPIEQAAVIINRGQEETKRRQAEQFYDFLFSPEGKKLLKKYGYSTN